MDFMFMWSKTGDVHATVDSLGARLVYVNNVYLRMRLVFIEAPGFARQRDRYLNDDEYTDLQAYLAFNPNIGDVIPRSEGLRKVRWAGKGRGKRGGLRIIYYHFAQNGQIWLLAIYSKNEVTNMSDDELRMLRKEV